MAGHCCLGRAQKKSGSPISGSPLLILIEFQPLVMCGCSVGKGSQWSLQVWFYLSANSSSRAYAFLIRFEMEIGVPIRSMLIVIKWVFIRNWCNIVGLWNKNRTHQIEIAFAVFERVNSMTGFHLRFAENFKQNLYQDCGGMEPIQKHIKIKSEKKSGLYPGYPNLDSAELAQIWIVVVLGTSSTYLSHYRYTSGA